MVQRYILPPVWLWPRLNAAVPCWGETRTGPFRNKFACRRWRIKHTRTKVYNQSVGNIIVIPTRQHSWDTACYWVLQSVSDNKTDAEQLGGAAVDSSAVQYCLSGTIFWVIFAARHGLHIWKPSSSLHSVSVYNLLTLLRPAATAGILSQLSIITQDFPLQSGVGG